MTDSKETKRKIRHAAVEENRRVKAVAKMQRGYENVVERGGKQPRNENGRFVKGHYEGITYSPEDKKRMSDKVIMSFLRTVMERYGTLDSTLDWLEANDPKAYAQTLMSMAKLATPIQQNVDITLDVGNSIERLVASRMGVMLEDDRDDDRDDVYLIDN